MTKMIEVGNVVMLKSGGPAMTVTEVFVMKDDNVSTPAQNGDCPICGRYPVLESSDPQVMATIMHAQQVWRSRHDAHVVNPMRVRCGWMREGVCDDAIFPLEAVRLVEDNDELVGFKDGRPVTRGIKRRRDECDE